MAEKVTIRCMQLPMNEFLLLLPNSAVAEIIGYVAPDQEHKGEGWFEGLISWRGVMVPIISIEKMCQLESIKPTSRSRIVVIYNPDGGENLPYIGVILQDIPRAYIAEEDRLTKAFDKLDCNYLLTHADETIDNLIIPNLDALVEAVRQRISH